MTTTPYQPPRLTYLKLRPTDDNLGELVYGTKWPTKKKEMMTSCPFGPVIEQVACRIVEKDPEP
jgi:hypothetical protein